MFGATGLRSAQAYPVYLQTGPEVRAFQWPVCLKRPPYGRKRPTRPSQTGRPLRSNRPRFSLTEPPLPLTRPPLRRTGPHLLFLFITALPSALLILPMRPNIEGMIMASGAHHAASRAKSPHTLSLRGSHLPSMSSRGGTQSRRGNPATALGIPSHRPRIPHNDPDWIATP